MVKMLEANYRVPIKKRLEILCKCLDSRLRTKVEAELTVTLLSEMEEQLKAK